MHADLCGYLKYAASARQAAEAHPASNNPFNPRHLLFDILSFLALSIASEIRMASQQQVSVRKQQGKSSFPDCEVCMGSCITCFLIMQSSSSSTPTTKMRSRAWHRRLAILSRRPRNTSQSFLHSPREKSIQTTTRIPLDRLEIIFS